MYARENNNNKQWKSVCWMGNDYLLLLTVVANYFIILLVESETKDESLYLPSVVLVVVLIDFSLLIVKYMRKRRRRQRWKLKMGQKMIGNVEWFAKFLLSLFFSKPEELFRKGRR